LLYILSGRKKERIKKLLNRKPLCDFSVNIIKRLRDSKDFKRP
jgi:hypothetical protein